MKKLLFLFFSSLPFFCINTVIAQSNQNQNRTFNSRDEILATTPLDRSIKGTPYLVDKWSNATVVFSPNHVVDRLKIKYNLYFDEVLILKSTGDSVALLNQNITSFTFEDEDKRLKKYVNKYNLPFKTPSIKNTFVQVLYSSENLIFIKVAYSKVSKAEKVQSSYSTSRNYDEYFTIAQYFILKNGLDPQEVRLNRRNLLTLYEASDKKVKSFLSKNKIDTNSEEGWAKVMAYYETL